MNEQKQAIWSERVRAGRVNYFLDVRESANGRVFLSMAQSSLGDDETWRRERIVVFEDGLAVFRRAVLSALRIIGREADERRDADLDELRKTCPRAFEKWSEDDESALRQGWGSGMTEAELAVRLGRTQRAIGLRLQKLGLQPVPEAGASA